MRLNERDIRLIAAGAGVGEKAVSRLLGSLRVKLPRPSEDAESPPAAQELELGLRLQSAEVLTGLLGSLGKDETLKRLEKATREYFSACPVICGWVGRGDFDAKAIPAQVTKALILHACRTAGRIRAKVLSGR